MHKHNCKILNKLISGHKGLKTKGFRRQNENQTHKKHDTCTHLFFPATPYKGMGKAKYKGHLKAIYELSFLEK